MEAYKMRIKNIEESRRVQEHAFKLGYKWANAGAIKQEAHAPFLYLYSDGDIFFGHGRNNFIYNEGQKITPEEFLKIPVPGEPFRGLLSSLVYSPLLSRGWDGSLYAQKEMEEFDTWNGWVEIDIKREKKATTLIDEINEGEGKIEMKKKLEVDIVRRGEVVEVQVLHQDESLREKGVIIEKGKYKVISQGGPALARYELFVRGGLPIYDKDIETYTFPDEIKAIDWVENITMLIDEINGGEKRIDTLIEFAQKGQELAKKAEERIKYEEALLSRILEMTRDFDCQLSTLIDIHIYTTMHDDMFPTNSRLLCVEWDEPTSKSKKEEPEIIERFRKIEIA